MKLSVAEGALATAMGTLSGGVFLTGFALALGASRLEIGILAALPAICSLAQVGGSWVIERGCRRKLVCLGSLAASRSIWLAIIALPALAAAYHPKHLSWWLVALAAASALLASVGGVAWLCWIKDLVPGNRRVDFLGRRNLANGVVSLSLCMAGAVFIDFAQAHEPGALWGFMGVFAVAMLCGLVGLPLMAAIPEPARAEGARAVAQREGYSTLLAKPLAEANFRRVVGFYAFWNLSVHMAAPFFAVYMLEKLRLPFWYVTGLATLASVAGLMANGFWTRLSRHFGIKPVVFIATLADAFYPLWWIFVGPEGAWVLVLVHLSGVFNAPLALGPHNIVLKLAPERNASCYMAVFGAVVGPVSALAAVLGGWLAGVGDAHWTVGPVALGGLQLVFLISSAGRLVSLLLLHRIVEPQSVQVLRLVRVMGRTSGWRQLQRIPARLSARRLDRPKTPAVAQRPAA